MSLLSSIARPLRQWYARSIIGKSNASLVRSKERQAETAKIIFSRKRGISPLDDYIWGVGKPRD